MGSMTIHQKTIKCKICVPKRSKSNAKNQHKRFLLGFIPLATLPRWRIPFSLCPTNINHAWILFYKEYNIYQKCSHVFYSHTVGQGSTWSTIDHINAHWFSTLREILSFYIIVSEFSTLLKVSTVNVSTFSPIMSLKKWY